jgi:hypothetical protein
MTKSEMQKEISRLEGIISFQSKMENERNLKIDALESSIKAIKEDRDQLVAGNVEEMNTLMKKNFKLSMVISNMAEKMFGMGG